MTAIVGVETKNSTVVIGADSAGTASDFSFIQLADEKVWTNGDWIFGVCGSFRLCQLLRYSLTLPQIPDDDNDLNKFLVTEFVDAVRTCILYSGIVQSKNALESIIDDSDFLVGVRGRLYMVQSDFSMIRSALGYYATGIGMPLALGSLYSTPKMSPKNRVRVALESAAQHNSAVAPPFVILESR